MKKRIYLLVMIVMFCILGVMSKQDIVSASEVNTITIGKTTEGCLVGGEEDYYSIIPSEKGQLTITITGKVPASLTAAILDENNVNTYRTKTVDYNAEKGNETLKYVVYVNPIKYHLRIGANNSVGGEYTIKTSLKPFKEEIEANHSIDTAYVIKNNQYINGYLAIDSMKDYYKIEIKEGKQLKFSVDCYSASSVTVGVIKPSEDFVTYTGNAGFNKYRYEFDQSVPAGTYIIVISDNGSAMIEEGRKYSLATGNYVVTKEMKTIPKKVMYAGKTYNLKVTRTPEGATEKLKYTTSDKKVVTVSSTGKLSAKGKGTATITVTGVDTGIKQKVTITVKEIPVKKVQITTAAKSLYKGESLELTAKITPSNATQSKAKWKSSNPSVATVDSTGTVKAKAAGSCTITATAGAKKATCKIVVKEYVVITPPEEPTVPDITTPDTTTPEKPEIKTITMESSIRLSVGDKRKISFTISPSDADSSKLTWKSSDSSVASVKNGTITCEKAGYATIIVKASNGVTAMCTVYVSE